MGWDKIPSLLSVEHYEGRGGCRRVGLGSKVQVVGEVPITTLPSRKEAVRQSILQSPRCSARKHASALGISNCSVRRILHQDLHFHPYKMVVFQELAQQDWINRAEACQHLIERLPDDAVVFLVIKYISIDNDGQHFQDILFKTSLVVVSESKNKIFVSRIVFFVIHLKI
jgi:hypothetical protein